MVASTTARMHLLALFCLTQLLSLAQAVAQNWPVMDAQSCQYRLMQEIPACFTAKDRTSAQIATFRQKSRRGSGTGESFGVPAFKTSCDAPRTEMPCFIWKFHQETIAFVDDVSELIQVHERVDRVSQFNATGEKMLTKLDSQLGVSLLQRATPFGTSFWQGAQHWVHRMRFLAAQLAQAADGRHYIALIGAVEYVLRVESEFLFQVSNYLLSPLALESDALPITLAHRQSFHRDIGLHRSTIVHQLLRMQLRRAREAGRKAVRMLEVGVNDARNAEFLLDANPELQYVGIDPYTEDTESAIEGDARYTQASTRLMRFRSRAHLLRSTSVDSAPLFKDGLFDLVFIDGDHRFPAVMSDLEAWGPKVASGGFLSGHDYGGAKVIGVVVAVSAHFGTVNNSVDSTLHLAPDSVWFWEVS